MAELRALFFDQDGTIIDTEKDGHRVAFNRVFEEFGFPVEWDVETYHELLQIAGGKERMRTYLNTTGFGKPVPEHERDDLIASLHKRKTEILVEMLKEGQLPLRPGIKRLMREANERGVLVGICTTSSEVTARAIAQTMLGDVDIEFILAGDMVTRKKPDPEIYHLAVEKAGIEPAECLVIEDSKNGVDAARAAGLKVLATTNHYTEREDLSSADIVVTCLGDPNGEKAKVKRGSLDAGFHGVVSVDDLVAYMNHS